MKLIEVVERLENHVFLLLFNTSSSLPVQKQLEGSINLAWYIVILTK